MKVLKRTGIGVKDEIIIGADSRAELAFRVGGEWFLRRVGDRREKSVAYIGAADSALLAPDGRTLVYADGKLKYL